VIPREAAQAPLLGAFMLNYQAIGRMYLDGQTGVLSIVSSGLPLFMVLAIGCGIMGTAAGILFAIGMWQAGTLPKGAIVMYACSIPLFYFAPPAPFAVELSGQIAFSAASAWLGFALRKR
jgi:hypothetical protein